MRLLAVFLAVMALTGCQQQLAFVGTSFSSDSLLEADEVTIVATGPVSLLGGVKARRLSVRAASLEVGARFEVGEASIEADDKAITFATSTSLQGTTSDVDDIRVSPGVTLTLTGDTTLAADSNGDGAGLLSFGPGARVVGPHRLVLRGSGTSTLRDLDVDTLRLEASTPCARFSLEGTSATARVLELEGATLSLSSQLKLTGSPIVLNGHVEATGSRDFEAFDFASAGPQTVALGGSGLPAFSHSGKGALTFTSRYTTRTPFTVPALDGGTTVLSDFPVALVVRGDHPVFMNPGAVLVVDEQQRPLPVEVERFDGAARELVVWTRLSRFDTTRGASVALLSGAATEPACNAPESVWSRDYVAVFHFAEADGGLALDSTRFGNHATPEGTAAATGRIGLGRRIEGGNRLRIPALPPLSTSELTFEVQAAPTGLSGPGLGGNRLLDRSWLADPGKWAFFVWEARQVSFNGMNDAGVRVGFGKPVIFALDQWFSTTAVIEPGAGTMWVDGTHGGRAALDFDGGSPLDSAAPLCVSSCYPWDAYSGILDELRLSSVARSDDWVRASSRAISDPPPPGPSKPFTFSLPTGARCRPEVPCESGHCVDGRCCERACGTCETCDDPGAPGRCMPVVSAPDPDSCASCDSTGRCIDGGVVVLDGGAGEAPDGGAAGGLRPGPGTLRVGCGCTETTGGALFCLIALMGLCRPLHRARLARSRFSAADVASHAFTANRRFTRASR